MSKTDEKLDKLTELVNSLASELNANVHSIKEDIAGIKDQLPTIETNVDTKLDTFKQTVKKDIEDLKEDVTKDINEKVDTEITGLREEVVELRQGLTRAERTINRMSTKFDVPFPPETSVVIYGLQNNEGEDEEETVNWLFAEVLKVDVSIDNIERTKPRDTGRIGVIKVELSSVQEKIEVLRNKLKCDELMDNDKVIIKSCESHDARVGRINNKLLLSLIPKGNEYTITGHGIIKKKEDNKSANGQIGGNGSDAAGPENAQDAEAVARELGDNRDTRASSEPKQNDAAQDQPSKPDNDRMKKTDQSEAGAKNIPNKKGNNKQKPRGGDPAKPPKRSERLQSKK